MERSNDPTARRPKLYWRTPSKPKLKEGDACEFGSFESLCGNAGSSDDDDSRLTKTVTAVATPITQASDISSPGAGNSPRPSFRLYEEDDGHSMQWSLEPGSFATRPIHDLPTINAVPVSPDSATNSYISSSPRRITQHHSASNSYISSSPPRRIHRHPQPDLSLFHEDESMLLWGEDPEKEYFEYMLRLEQEQRARQGKPAEDSLVGDR